MEPEIQAKPLRYYEIDLLRFIAAISVVLFHYTYYGFQKHNLSPVAYPALGEIFKYGYLGVNLFFIISGYVVLMSAQGKTLSQFFISRVTRLYPAFWVGCTLCFLVIRAFGPAVHTPGWSPYIDAPLHAYFYNMTMLQGFFGVADIDGVYWTLTNEISFYFIISILISFGWIRYILAVLTVWLAYCWLMPPNEAHSPFATLLFPQSAPYFIAGMCLYLIQSNQGAKWKTYGLLLASYALAMRVSIAGVSSTRELFQQPFSLNIILVLTTSFFVVLLLIVLRKINLGQSKWLAIAGSVTYPLYLLHQNIGYVLLQRLGGHVDKYALLVGLLVVMLLAAYLVHTYVEQPLSKSFNKKLYAWLAK